jgi:glycogen operon protein
MLLHGDEIGRTQRGNNNAYCQDNEISWVDWRPTRERVELREFTERVARLRAAHPVFRRRRFFHGRPVRGSRRGLTDIEWLRPTGARMQEEDWAAGVAKSMTVFLNGDAITEPGLRGEKLRDDSFLLLFNGDRSDFVFTLPGATFGNRWEIVLDTVTPGVDDGREVKSDGEIDMMNHSLVVLRRLQ